MSVSIEKVAEVLTLKKEETVEEGLRALLEKKLRELRAESISTCLKYKVSSLREFDEKINRGSLAKPIHLRTSLVSISLKVRSKR